MNFKNPAEFKKSLKRALRKSLNLHSKKYRYFAKYKHSFEIVLEKIGEKIGIIKED